MRARSIVIVQFALVAGLALLLSAPAADQRALAAARAGDERLTAGEYGAAAGEYRAAWQRRPLSGELPLRLGQAYLSRREAGAALQPLVAAYSRLRGRRQAEAAAQIGDASAQMGAGNQAQRWWETALAQDAGNRRALLGLAGQAAERQEWERAAALLRLLLASAPADAEAGYRLGVALLALDAGAARAALDRVASLGFSPWSTQARRLGDALRSASNDAYGATQLGRVLLELGELTPALYQLDRAVALAPDYAQAHAYRGQVLAMLGRPALDAFQRALALDPHLVLAHYFLGRYYMEQRLPDLARGEFEAALALDRENPALGVDIALSYAAEANYVAAEAWIEAAIARAGDDVGLHAARARFYVERNYRVAERGLPAIDRLLALAPQSAEAHDLHGWALYWLGESAAARAELERALTLDPQRAATHVHLGVLLAGAGQGDAARRHLERAIDLDPTGYYGSWARSLLSGLSGSP